MNISGNYSQKPLLISCFISILLLISTFFFVLGSTTDKYNDPPTFAEKWNQYKTTESVITHVYILISIKLFLLFVLLDMSIKRKGMRRWSSITLFTLAMILLVFIIKFLFVWMHCNDVYYDGIHVIPVYSFCVNRGYPYVLSPDPTFFYTLIGMMGYVISMLVWIYMLNLPYIQKLHQKKTK